MKNIINKLKNQQTIINMLCSLAITLLTLLISFWLSPFIVKTLGVEANGFVTLANNFVTYAALLVTALNSMAARFISIEYNKKNYNKANIYYNSVFWGNLIIVAVLVIPAVITIVYLEKLINIPNELVSDVKLTFSIVFISFFLTTGVPNWSCATFVTNRLDRSYIPELLTTTLRTIMIFSMFTILTPHVWYVSLTSLLVTFITLGIQVYNQRKLTPMLYIGLKKNKRICSKQAIKELVGSGIWNSISSVGTMLLSGLDLLICNLFINSTAMGILSLSKSLPGIMQSFSASITGAFAPEMVIDYANDNKKKLLFNIKRSMRLTQTFLLIPLCGIIVMGQEFFSLWVPSQDAKQLSILSSLACLGYAFTSGTQILYNVFQTTNKVKANAVSLIISGIVSTIIVFICLKTTSLGVYIIAGTSSFVNVFKNMLFVVPFTSKCLGLKKTAFYPQVISSVLGTVIIVVVGYFTKSIFNINGWISFFGVCILIGMEGLIINSYLILNKEERKMVFNKIKNKLIK